MSPLVPRWPGSPSSCTWVYASVSALHLLLLQLRSVLDVVEKRKRLELLAFSVLFNFEELNLI